MPRRSRFGEAGALLSMFDADESPRQADIEIGCTMLRWDCRKARGLSLRQLCVYHVHEYDVLFGRGQQLREVGGASHAAYVAQHRIESAGYNTERAAVLIGWCRWHAAHREWLEGNVRWPLWRTYVEAANRVVHAQSGKEWFKKAVSSVPPFELPQLPSEEELKERKRDDAEKEEERYASSSEALMWDEMLRLYEEKGRGFGQLGVQAELKRRGVELDQSNVSRNLNKAWKRRDDVLVRDRLRRRLPPPRSRARRSQAKSAGPRLRRSSSKRRCLGPRGCGGEGAEPVGERAVSHSWACYWLGSSLSSEPRG